MSSTDIKMPHIHTELPGPKARALLARDRAAFLEWIDVHVLRTRTHADFLTSLAA